VISGYCLRSTMKPPNCTIVGHPVSWRCGQLHWLRRSSKRAEAHRPNNESTELRETPDLAISNRSILLSLFYRNSPCASSDLTNARLVLPELKARRRLVTKCLDSHCSLRQNGRLQLVSGNACFSNEITISNSSDDDVSHPQKPVNKSIPG